MIKKDKKLKKIMKVIKNAFSTGTFSEVDYWNDYFSAGLQKGVKVIYISTVGCKKNYYFYELEQLVDDPNKVYISQGVDEVTEDHLLKVIENFFAIRQK